MQSLSTPITHLVDGGNPFTLVIH